LDPCKFENGASQYSLNICPAKVLAQKIPKFVFPAALAPSSAGPVVAVSNDCTMVYRMIVHLYVMFQMNTKKIQEALDLFSSQFEAHPKFIIACEIDKIYLLT
jgi:hypothetical protein